jgi:hypothetical protein
MAVMERIKAFIGVPQLAKGVDRVQQLEAALADSDIAVVDAHEAKELALLAVEDGEAGAPQRLAAAQRDLEQVQQARVGIQDALRAARLLADRRVAKETGKTRTAAWRQAERLAEERVTTAGKLAEALRIAGEHYAELVRLGHAAYDHMPARIPGGPSMYRLASGDVAAVVGIDVLRAGLPDGARISLSLLSQYPGSVEVAESSLELIRLARREDEAK